MFFTYNFVRARVASGAIFCVMNPLTANTNNQLHRGQTDQ